MKPVYILLYSLIILSACKKNHSADNTSSIIGKWELRRVEGGWSGLVIYPPGNGNSYTFNNDSTYIEVLQPQPIIHTGTYSLVRSSIPGQWTLKLFPLGSGFYPTMEITFNDTSLVFVGANYIDQPTITFRRL